MPIIRKALRPEEVYPTTLRYNPDTETVQTLVNGTWADNPLADPRKQTTLPPHITDNTACDAAESVKDALKKQVDQTCAAIDASQTVFTIVALILAVLSFGFYGIFFGLIVTLVHDLIDVGTAAINAALTTTVYHTFTCILFCHMDDNGRLKPGGFDAVKSDITAQIGGLGALVLHKMLDLAGEGGVNNLASLGTSTGTCEDCDCGCEITGWGVVYVGTELGRGINEFGQPYVDLRAAYDASEVGGYGVIFKSPDDDTCCKILSSTTLSGSVTGIWFYCNCGEALPDYGVPFPHSGLIPTGEVRALGLNSASAFDVRWVWG